MRQPRDFLLAFGKLQKAKRQLYLPTGIQTLESRDHAAGRNTGQRFKCEADFDAPDTRYRNKLMAAMDVINDRFGRSAMHVGTVVGGSDQRYWSTQKDRLTLQHTTKISDLPFARA